MDAEANEPPPLPSNRVTPNDGEASEPPPLPPPSEDIMEMPPIPDAADEEPTYHDPPLAHSLLETDDESLQLLLRNNDDASIDSVFMMAFGMTVQSMDDEL
jgi:hypothetical protein